MNVERLRTRTGPLLMLAALVLLAGSALVAWWLGARLDELPALGVPGVFLLMIISGSAYFPVPGPPAVMAAGALWSPLLVGIAAGLGNSTGEMSSYLLGRAAASTIDPYRETRFFSLLEHALKRRGFLVIFLLASIPNPTFHALTLLAGSVGYPARRYWAACALGNSVKYTAMAALGSSLVALLAGALTARPTL